MVNIIIDGNTFKVNQSLTLLNAAEECGITIPSLCKIDGFHHNCDLCDVEVEHHGTVKACRTYPTEGMVITTTSTALIQRRKHALEQILSAPNISCSVPPCQVACPADVDIQSYLYFIALHDALPIFSILLPPINHKKPLKSSKKHYRCHCLLVEYAPLFVKLNVSVN